MWLIRIKFLNYFIDSLLVLNVIIIFWIYAYSNLYEKRVLTESNIIWERKKYSDSNNTNFWYTKPWIKYFFNAIYWIKISIAAHRLIASHRDLDPDPFYFCRIRIRFFFFFFEAFLSLTQLNLLPQQLVEQIGIKLLLKYFDIKAILRQKR